jgi:hypothetical protein
VAEFDGVSKDTFVEADQITSRKLMYDMLSKLRTDQKKLIDRKNFDTAASSFLGMMGGAVAIIAQTIFRK